MALTEEVDEVVEISVETVYKTLLDNLKYKGWMVNYMDEFADENGKEVREVFGVTTAFGASTFMSLFGHGARFVPFFVKVKEVEPGRSRIQIITGGSEDMFGFDYGRNKRVVQELLKLCTGEVNK